MHLNTNCSKFQVANVHPYACHTQNGMQEGDDSSPQIFNSTIESIMKTFWENQGWSKNDCNAQVLMCSVDSQSLGKSNNTLEANHRTSVRA
jgi:hypothetical protein